MTPTDTVGAPLYPPIPPQRWLTTFTRRDNAALHSGVFGPIPMMAVEDYATALVSQGAFAVIEFFTEPFLVRVQSEVAWTLQGHQDSDHKALLLGNHPGAHRLFTRSGIYLFIPKAHPNG